MSIVRGPRSRTPRRAQQAVQFVEIVDVTHGMDLDIRLGGCDDTFEIAPDSSRGD